MNPMQFGADLALRQLKGGAEGLLGSKDKDPVAENTSPDILGGFGKLLANHINGVNNMQIQADKMTQDYALGGKTELHQVMIATEKAEMGLEMTMQLRNKLVQAYQEINHMAV